MFTPFVAAPRFDDQSYIVNGDNYSNEKLENGTLSAREPYAVAARYSNDLNDLVRHCLRYDPTERPSLETLREIIKTRIARGFANDAPAADKGDGSC
jgi:hypothetical protein